MQTFFSAPWWFIVVPLLGAVLILSAGHRLPRLARRLVAVAAIGSVLLSLRTLGQTPETGGFELAWLPLNLFRLGVWLQPDPILRPLLGSLGLFLLALNLGRRLPPGLAVAGLVGLAAVAALAQGANLLTLAVASSLLDLSLALYAIRSPSGADRTSWQILVPGVSSTLLLVLATLHMDAAVGSASLDREAIPALTLNLLLAAGVLRLLPFPIHPRAAAEPGDRLIMVVSLAVGVGLLVRLEGIAPGWGQKPALAWVVWLTLLVGALLATLGRDSQRLTGFWLAGSGGLIWLTAWSGGGFPVLLPALLWSLGLLEVWFTPGPSEAVLEWRKVRSWLEPHVAGVPWPSLVRRIARRLRSVRWHAVLPLWAVASLIGLPLTAGLPARLALIHTTLAVGEPGPVLLDIASATLLVVGALALGRRVLDSPAQRIGPGTRATLVVLALGLFWLGIAPGSVTTRTIARPDLSWLSEVAMVSAPWLLGAAVYVVGRRAAQDWRALRQLAWQFLHLQWLRAPLGWLGRQAAAVGWWLGDILEGEGSMGWALFLLVLVAILFLVP
jgi:hypothetical protein